MKAVRHVRRMHVLTAGMDLPGIYRRTPVPASIRLSGFSCSRNDLLLVESVAGRRAVASGEPELVVRRFTGPVNAAAADAGFLLCETPVSVCVDGMSLWHLR